MTLIATPIAVHAPGDVPYCLEQASEAIAAGANLIEWRIDTLGEDPDAAAAVARLVDEISVPSIVTCRPIWEGGAYAGDETTRISLFEAVALAEHPPRYIDVELAALQRSANIRQKVGLGVDHPRQVRDAPTGLILSSHDMDGRPADLLQRVEALAHEDMTQIVKLAWHARSLRDNLEAFDLLADRQKPMIALCMGPFGLPSRVLAPKFGGFLTFAAISNDMTSAPGQPTIDELRNRYRFDEIGNATKVYGVIGWPVHHSRSPDIHNAGFTATGHDGVYLPLPIPPEYEHFKATVGALVDHPRLDFSGASVTIPHKTHLVRYVEERGGVVDEISRRAGAANTLIVRDGAVSCTNTDGLGAVDALEAVTQSNDWHGRAVAVLGTGGVSRGIASHLRDLGATVTLFSREPERAGAVAAELNDGAAASINSGDAARLESERFDVYVNGTPLGMVGGPDPDASPLPASAPLDAETTVFDTVYTPPRTPLIREAEARGARVVTGVDLFIAQAARQFETWTGTAAPLGDFATVLGRP